MTTYQVKPVGRVRSELKDLASAPMQGHEGAPQAWIEFEPDVLEALDGLAEGDGLILLTWFDRADRSTLKVHPRDDRAMPRRGVFATRSPDRPNPIGLHPVRVLAVDGARVLVDELEAIDGTPIVDVKPQL